MFRFIRSEKGILNVSYIRRIYIQQPERNTKRYTVVAELDGLCAGDEILHRADTEEECARFIENFFGKVNHDEFYGEVILR